MNKTELGVAVAAVLGESKTKGAEAVEAVLSVISETLQSGEAVKLIGFGNFEVRETNARKGRNPQTGAEIDIPAGRKPVWGASDKFKDSFK